MLVKRKKERRSPHQNTEKSRDIDRIAGESGAQKSREKSLKADVATSLKSNA